MTITEQFKAKRCVFSIECFPPKQTTQMDKLKDTLRQMQAMDPGFISVTFGAGGSAGGVSTAEVADYIQNELHVHSDGGVMGVVVITSLLDLKDVITVPQNGSM